MMQGDSILKTLLSSECTRLVHTSADTHGIVLPVNHTAAIRTTLSVSISEKPPSTCRRWVIRSSTLSEHVVAVVLIRMTGVCLRKLLKAPTTTSFSLTL